MKLDELKQMIQEEFESYMKEEDVDVTVGDDDVDAGMDKDPAEALEKIYQMLQDYFEADGEDNDNDGVEDEPGEEPIGETELEETKSDEADLEEAAAQGFGDPGAKNTSGKDSGYTPAKTTRGDGKLHEEEKSALQERFQKLANIIK